MIRTGLYTGSFDPLTNGHVDVIAAAARLCDRLVVAIGIHPAKVPMFEAAERAAMIASVCVEPARAAGCTLDVVTFDGLAIEEAGRLGASVIIRGLRDGTDFDYEMQMVGMNATLAPDVQTIFVPATRQTRHITATLVRQIAALGGDITAFVPAEVVAAIGRTRRA